MARRGIRIIGHAGLGKHVDARIVSGLDTLLRLEGDGVHHLVTAGADAGDTTTVVLETDGGLRLGTEDRIDPVAEFVTLHTQGSERNLLRAYAGPAANPSGHFQLSITDACSIYTHGAIASDGGSQIPGQIALLGKTFMIGANSDIAAGADAAVYVSFARTASLDHFQFVSGPETLRLRILHDGELEWWQGSGPSAAVFKLLPTSTGMKIGTGPTQRIGFYGATPVVQPSANPDTSGATLAALETEVNQVKQALRDVGLLAAA